MLTLIDQFFESIAVTMPEPASYGAFHIIYTLSSFAICILAAWKLRKVNDKTARWITFSVGLVLSLSEVFKQFFYYFAMSETNRYSWGDFPFQLCSVPLCLCLIAPWLKPGKLQRGMYSFMVLYNLLGGAIAFTEPSGLLHDRVFLTCHSLIWHSLLVFIGLFLCFSNRGGNEKADYKGATGTFLALSLIAFLLNLFVQQVLGEHMNMFFVGPGESPIVVFKQFSQWFGWYVNTPIYLFAVSLGAYIIHCIIYFAQNKRLPFSKASA